MDISDIYKIYKKHPQISTDTRKIQANSIFFALKGSNFNGNTFAEEALSLGASYAIVDEAHFAKNEKIIVVNDVLQTLQQLALYHRRTLNIPFLAITGSNGKTTTKELIYAVLATKYKTVATIGNLNNHIGVPLTILSIPADTEIAIIEMGANHLGEIASYCTYTEPNFALINNCGKAHLEGFGSIEGVRKGKGELYDFIREHGGTIFINNDLDYLKDLSIGISQKVSYGQANADIIGKDVSDSPFLSVAILNHLLEIKIDTQLTGSYNLPNVLAAVAVGICFKISIEAIKAALENYKPSNSRSQWMKTDRNEIIIDAYNANPSSMEVAIQNFNSIPHQDKVLLLGSMKEVGDYSKTEHQKLVDMCQDLGFEQVFLVGPEFAEVNKREYSYFDTSDSLATYISQQNWNSKLILIKGSRGSKMEKVLNVL
jgi:UDP-N-acetylmuramoyl-tripeptide--D-alanyl-D-alanine ligase